MFIICNAVDQTNLKWSREKRIVEALRHAGPSVTITSLTDFMAFLAGSSSSIPAISHFCMYASTTVACLYLVLMTVFLSVVTWDTWRVEQEYRECLGLCFCKENSILFCKGKLLSDPQK